MPNIGVPELIVILAILLLLFGARRLPEIARSVGRSARELKRGLSDHPGEDETAGGSSVGGKKGGDTDA